MEVDTAPVGIVASQIPLCVDLDGTLVKTDTLLEAVLVLLKRNPLALLMLPLWLLRGRAHLKRQVASAAPLDPVSLPYNTEFLSYLYRCRSEGRRLILVTAADRLIADKITAHLGLFSEVFASNGSTNLKGKAKLELLVGRYGEQQFDYAGNSKPDLKIWAASRQSVLVRLPPAVSRNLRRLNKPVVAEFAPPGHTIRSLRKALRVHQWVKNGLVFVPPMLAHRFSLTSLATSFLGFLAFSLTASTVYLLNDLLDLSADRVHPTKKFRPFAAGDLPLWLGVALIPLFSLVTAGLCWFLSSGFDLLLLIYAAVSLGYCFYFKRKLVLDVIVLAGLYTIRLLAGGALQHVFLSQWLLGFAMFIFLSLALEKRVIELRQGRLDEKDSSRGRGYLSGDLELLSAAGISAGLMSVMILALYMNSPEVARLYRNPQWLWLICPLIVYWTTRSWVLARRGSVNDDPVVFALRDRASYAVGFCAVVLFLISL